MKELLLIKSDLIETITTDLNSDETSVKKLKKLNNNLILNELLHQQNYKPIQKAIQNILCNNEESDENKEILEIYLQELRLIFNLY